MALRVVGAGLSRTGTTSLHAALQALGFGSLHFDSRLDDVLNGCTPNPSFRRYDDVDAVLDLPAALFYRELLDAYPSSKAVLTVRDIDAWWKSIAHHFNVRSPIPDPLDFPGCRLQLSDYDRFRTSVRNHAYGSVVASEFLYKKRYTEHIRRVMADVPPSRLLIMDITAGDGWDVLCPFLGVAVPPEPFPHENSTLPV